MHPSNARVEKGDEGEIRTWNVPQSILWGIYESGLVLGERWIIEIPDDSRADRIG